MLSRPTNFDYPEMKPRFIADIYNDEALSQGNGFCGPGLSKIETASELRNKNKRIVRGNKRHFIIVSIYAARRHPISPHGSKFARHVDLMHVKDGTRISYV